MKDLAIYGFGGFGREIACIINNINEITPTWNLIGFFDDNVLVGNENRYGKVLGGIEVLNGYKFALNVIIAVANPEILEKLSNKIKNNNISFPNLIAPNVHFFDRNSIFMGKGNIITNSCRISCDVKLCDFNILNGSVSLGHDVQIGNYNVLFPDSRISGEVQIGNNNLFGARSFVYQGVYIGDFTKISAGSFISNNTKNHYLYTGNPARGIEY